MSQNIVIRESEQEPAQDNNFNEINLLIDQLETNGPFVDQLFNTEDFEQIAVAGVCNGDDLKQSIGWNVQTSDLDIYLREPTNQNSPSSMVVSPNSFNEFFASLSTTPSTNSASLETPVELSRSVGVGHAPSAFRQSHKISLVHPLEKTYRPRYKSDYFAQNGTTRKPRYVADRQNNHFITLQVPKGISGCIRIDWVTVPTKAGDIYSMPYRFQTSNDKIEIPDSNPLFIPIEADTEGKMKIYVVLIKAKQDDLKTLQPLKRFEPLKQAFGCLRNSTSEKEPILMPKQLIQKYQLEKSQLAFTFCSLSSDGNEWIPQWDTTIYSTVLTEYSPDPNRPKAIACPNCSHSFPMPLMANEEEEITTKKRKKTQTSLAAKKQHSLPETETTAT